MSDYGSISDQFGEELDKHLGPVIEKQASCGCAGGMPMSDEDKVKELYFKSSDFLQRVVTDWLRLLDDPSRQDVDKLMDELSNVSTAEFISEMNARGMSSPYELLSTYFRGPAEGGEDEGVDDVEVVEVIDGEAV